MPLVSPQGAANLRSLMANTMHEVLAYMSQPQVSADCGILHRMWYTPSLPLRSMLPSLTHTATLTRPPTPLQAQQMVHSLTATLNRAYAKFNYRHRSFQGKVSILGHSLGSVMCYDVLCNQPSLYANLGVPTRPAPSTSIHFPALTFPGESMLM